MEPQTSFIPKKSLIKERAPATTSIGLITLLTVVSFLGVGLSTAFFWFYNNRILEKNILAMSEQVEAFKNPQKTDQFIPENVVAENLNVSSRLRSVKSLLDGHLNASLTLRFLENVTHPNLQYKRMDLVFDKDDRSPVLQMPGRASSYFDLAVQEQIFLKSPYVESFRFSNFSLDEEGRVNFDLQLQLSKRLSSFDEALKRLPENP